MNNRNMSIDILKIVLAILVVLLHCNIFRENYKVVSFLSVHGLFRIAVPIFFIVNGYFLNNVFKSGRINYWIKRVLILYGVWMLIYAPLWGRSELEIVIEKILDGYHHLWYLRAMLIGGIILYLMRKLSSKKLLGVSLFLFIIGVVIQYLGNFEVLSESRINNILNTTYIHRNFIFMGFPFMAIGFLMNREKWNMVENKGNIVLLTLISAALLCLESYFNFILTNKGIDNLLSLGIICPLIFVWASTSNFSLNVDSKLIAKISTAIYLIHPWIIFLLGAIYSFNSISLALLTLPISFVASIIMIKIDAKLNILL